MSKLDTKNSNINLLGISDWIQDRSLLKNRIKHWRFVALFFAFAALLSFLGSSTSLLLNNANVIGRVEISGTIAENYKTGLALHKIADDKNIKALLVYINSPGGSAVGGESLYKALKSISSVKPVVAIMGSVAASAGYMVAIAADQIFAHEGTVTGSIGTLFQYFEVTELMQKLGVSANVIRSSQSDLKGSPSPFEKISAKAQEAIQESIDIVYEYFIELISQERSIAKDQVIRIADGRVYTGKQALEYGLIDAIGGEQEAMEWLRSKGISYEIKELDLTPRKNFFNFFSNQGKSATSNFMSLIRNFGLMLF
jgi:protease-4